MGYDNKQAVSYVLILFAIVFLIILVGLNKQYEKITNKNPDYTNKTGLFCINLSEKTLGEQAMKEPQPPNTRVSRTFQLDQEHINYFNKMGYFNRSAYVREALYEKMQREEEKNNSEQ